MHNFKIPKFEIRGTGVVTPNPIGRFIHAVLKEFGLQPQSLQWESRRWWLRKQLALRLQQQDFGPEVRRTFVYDCLEEFGVQPTDRRKRWLAAATLKLCQYYEDQARIKAAGESDPDKLDVPTWE